ncbi:MAG TPA: hypothetical protein VEK79_05120 [Thermoanaerobaculia bacterium]|nr:hypothetical protein [Thermoanaerobaculia bacterium]
MKTPIAVVTTLLLTATAAFADMEGAWTARPHEKDPDKLQVSLSYSRSSNHSSSFSLSEVALTREQVYAATQTPVQFAWKREAGTVVFDGVFRNGSGGGQMIFTPNRNYLDAIKALGVEIDTGADDEELFTLAMVDVSAAYIRSMQAEGFRVRIEEYMSMAMFRVTPSYIREIRGLVGRDVSADKLVELKIHNVTPEYIREMRVSRPELSLDDLVEARIFRVTPEFAAEMARAGYRNLSHDDLVQLRMFNVTPEYIRQLAAAGYRNVPVQKLIEMRMFRIEPEFLDKMMKAGKRDD